MKKHQAPDDLIIRGFFLGEGIEVRDAGIPCFDRQGVLCFRWAEEQQES